MKEVQDRGVLRGYRFHCRRVAYGSSTAVFIVQTLIQRELYRVRLKCAVDVILCWFVVVTVLAAQSMPKNGNLVTDSLAVVVQAWIDFMEVFKLPPQDE